MRILISNDDGHHSPGLKSLVEGLQKYCNLASSTKNQQDSQARQNTTIFIDEISVVVPDRDRSGASNSLTLDRPLRAVSINQFPWLNEAYYLAGTPTDCVHIAITALLSQAPDIVISGINVGANLGDDVLYSGTVAAATEGRFLGFPALAVSLAIDDGENRYYDTAMRVVWDILQKLPEFPLSGDSILNINVPNLPYAELKGIKTTRLGKRHKAKPAVKSKDPRGNTVYWIGPVGNSADCGPGTDFHAIENAYVSITPLSIDLTDKSALQSLDKWVNQSFNTLFSHS